MDIKLSVIIPTFNGRKLLQQCLPTLDMAIRRAGWTGNVEIIVVDDRSGDDTVAWINLHRPDIKLIANDVNQGFTGSVNRGLSTAHGPWIALLNNDVLVDENWLATAIPHFSQSDIGAIASRIMMYIPPDRVESTGIDYTTVGIAVEHGNSQLMNSTAGIKIRTCFAGSGAAVFYRREALNQAGAYFYTALESYYEDVELGFRLVLTGWNTICEPESVVVHLGSATYGKASFSKKFNSSRNAEIVFFSCMPRNLLWRYFVLHYLAGVLHLVSHLANGTARAYLCGKIAFLLKHLPATFHRRKEVQAMKTISNQALRSRMTRNWVTSTIGSKFFSARQRQGYPD